MSIDQKWMVQQRALDQKRMELETRIAELYSRGGYVAIAVIERGDVPEERRIGRRWSMQEAVELLPLGALDAVT